MGGITTVSIRAPVPLSGGNSSVQSEGLKAGAPTTPVTSKGGAGMSLELVSFEVLKPRDKLQIGLPLQGLS